MRFEKMKYTGVCILSLLLLLPATAPAQDVVVDYNKPREYIVGGVSVEGCHYFSEQQIISLSGLQEGLKVTVPGEDISSIVKRLWLQKFFDDVSVNIDSLRPGTDTADFVIKIKERPRVSRWTFSGIRKGEQKELMDRLNLRRGGEFSEYVSTASTGVIKTFFKEKGFLKTEVDIQTQEDTVIHNAIRVNFDVNKGDKIRIKEINFDGNEHVSDYKLAKSMKKTKAKKFYNFFKSKKFDEKEYPNVRLDGETPPWIT